MFTAMSAPTVFAELGAMALFMLGMGGLANARWPLKILGLFAAAAAWWLMAFALLNSERDRLRQKRRDPRE